MTMSTLLNTKKIKQSSDIPKDATYAAAFNKNRCAINNAIFNNFLKGYHTKNKYDEPPDYSICIMSSIQEIFTEGGSKYCPGTVKDIIHTKCGDIHCTKAGSNKNQYIEPILK